MTGLEFHQDIHIAVRRKIVSKDRPKKRQPSDMVAPAELLNSTLWNRNSRLAHGFSSAFYLRQEKAGIRFLTGRE